MVTRQRLKCRPPMGGRITRVDVDTRVEAPRRARNGERDATSLGSRKPLAQSTCRCSARGSLWRKAAGLARRGERRAERPARLEEACGARQRARMRGKGRAGDEKIVSVAHLRMPRRSAAHLRMPRGGLAMRIRLPKIPRPEEACGATQPAGVGPSVAHAPRWRRATRIHSNRATAAPASQTPGAPKSHFSAIVVGVSDRKPSPQTRHRAPWPRNLKLNLSRPLDTSRHCDFLPM